MTIILILSPYTVGPCGVSWNIVTCLLKHISQHNYTKKENI